MRKSVIIKLLALAIAAASVIGMASCSLTDAETQEESTTEAPVVPAEARPETPEQMLDFFNRAVDEIKVSRPGVTGRHEYGVGDIDTGDTPEAGALMQFAKSFADALDGTEETKEYGEDLTEFLPLSGSDQVSRLTMEDVESIELNDNEEDRYVYEITIRLKDGKDTAANAFDFEIDKPQVLDTFAGYKDTLEVSDYDVSYSGCEIHATVQKETNRVLVLRYERDARVETSVHFSGTLESLGETAVAFTLHDTRTFENFVWDEPTSSAEGEDEEMLLG